MIDEMDEFRGIEIELEFDVVLVSPGPNQLQVAMLVRGLLAISPKEAIARIDAGEVTVATAVSHFEAWNIKQDLESIGATVVVR